MMLMHGNPVTLEGVIFDLQKLFHSSYDLIMVSKMATTQAGFEFRKLKEIRRSKVFWIKEVG